MEAIVCDYCQKRIERDEIWYRVQYRYRDRYVGGRRIEPNPNPKSEEDAHARCLPAIASGFEPEYFDEFVKAISNNTLVAKSS